MADTSPKILEQITFLYYSAIAPAAEFYERVFGLKPIIDQGWAKIYAIAPGARLGLVSGEKGFHRPQTHNAVLVSFVVNDAAAWHQRLTELGVPILRPLEDRPDIGIRTFFLQDPGGYTVEVQEFTSP